MLNNIKRIWKELNCKHNGRRVIFNNNIFCFAHGTDPDKVPNKDTKFTLIGCLECGKVYIKETIIKKKDKQIIKNQIYNDIENAKPLDPEIVKKWEEACAEANKKIPKGGLVINKKYW